MICLRLLDQPNKGNDINQHLKIQNIHRLGESNRGSLKVENNSNDLTSNNHGFCKNHRVTTIFVSPSTGNKTDSSTEKLPWPHAMAVSQIRQGSRMAHWCSWMHDAAILATTSKFKLVIYVKQFFKNNYTKSRSLKETDITNEVELMKGIAVEGKI